MSENFVKITAMFSNKKIVNNILLTSSESLSSLFSQNNAALKNDMI